MKGFSPTAAEIEAHQKRHGFTPPNTQEGAIFRATLPAVTSEASVRVPIPEKAPKGRGGAKKGPNQTEREYGIYLELSFPDSEVLFERYTLTLSAGCRYTPDWAVIHPNGALEFHEVKGAFIFSKALTKPKVAAEMFPHKFTLGQKLKTGWEIKVLPGKWKEVENHIHP